MKITDLKCAVIGQNPVVRINTDEGIHGLGAVETAKFYLKPHVLFYKDLIPEETRKYLSEEDIDFFD